MFIIKRAIISQPGIQWVQALADISRSPLCGHVHQLQIRPIVHN